jgi:predicted ester cyclase
MLLVAAHFVDTGTHLGTFLDVPATGRAVTTQELAVDLVADGRIAAAAIAAG